MRRLYESSAVERDDDEAFTPNERRDDSTTPQAIPRVPGNPLSRLLVPNRLRYRAISVSVDTRQETYDEGVAIPFVVTMRNQFPIPIEIPTQSPVLWTWAVNGDQEASRIPLADPPDESRGFRFDRGERKQFRKRWDQRFRVSQSEWEQARPGTYVISADINVEAPATKGLRGQTTVEIR